MEVADKVRKAAPDDLPQISTALSRAFLTDPLFAWALPDDQRRQRLLPEFFALFTKAFLRHDQSYTTTGEVVAAALWAPPRRGPGRRRGRRGAGPADPRARRTRRAPLPGVNKLFDDHHPRVLLVPAVLGGRPAWQGRGIGSVLMTPVLERCDREGVRADLDATSERNKRLYERHGLVAQDRFAPPGGPPIWPMWRQPASDR